MDNPGFMVECEHSGQPTGNEKALPRAHTFEEAIALTGVGRFQNVLLLFCGFSFMAVMCEIMGVSLIMPTMKCELLPTQSEQSILTSAAFLGIVLSSHAMGFLADTWGRLRTLRMAFILSTIMTVISAFSVNIWMLIVFRFLNGFFISGGQACIFTYCGEFHSNRTRARYVTLLAIFLPLAIMLLPLLATIILPLEIDFNIFGMNFSSWRLLILMNPIVSLIAIIGFCFLPEAPKYMLVQGDHDGALQILRNMFVANTRRPADEYPVKAIVVESGGASLANIKGFKGAVKMIWSQTTPLFTKERRWHTINICGSLFLVYSISQGFFMWFPTILNQLLDVDGLDQTVCQSINSMDTSATSVLDNCTGEVDTFMFNVMIIIGGIFSVLFLIFAYTIDFIGKKNLLYIWFVITIICAAVIHWISTFTLAVIALTLVMAIGNCGGLVGTIAVEFFPTNVNAMGMCFIMMVGRLGAVVGSYVMGQVLFNNCDLVFWIIAGIVCMELSLCTFLPERKRTKETPPK